MTGAHSAGSSSGGSRRRRTQGSVPSWWQPPRPDRLGRRAARAERVGSDPAPGRRHARPTAPPVPWREPPDPAGPPPGSARPGGRRRAGVGRRRAEPTPAERRGRRRRLVRRVALGALAVLLLGPLLAFALGYLLFGVPTPDQAVTNQVALVSYTDGSRLTRLVPTEGNRTAVPVDQVPRHVRDAVLAAEDRGFYSHPGFDLTGILRAVWNQLRGGSGGGSTITQQYVKNALVGDDHSLWRKFEEVVLAVKISQARPKDEILGDYLNAIYFGRGAYGIEAASQAYFGKPVQQLDVSEGALLAGVIQSPSRWDPAVDPDGAQRRLDFVLDGMVEQGWLSPADRAAAALPPTVDRQRTEAGIPADAGGHIVRAVTAELESLGITSDDLAQEGLRITTTIDPAQQEQAVAAVEEALEGQPDDLRAGMVAIDPATGGVTAYYGGANGVGLDYARVRRLAGSTFKPFVVLAGLQQDPPVGLGEQFDGEETGGLRNAEGADCPRCDLKQAMTVSNNVVFDTLAREVGPEAVAAAARSAGITSPLDEPTSRIALGDKEVSALELASAYATLAAGGVHHAPHFVAEVVTSDGTVLYSAPTGGERRFSERVARNVTESMLDVAAADGFDLPGDRPVAAKTGTVQHREDGENNDAWTAGYTPSLASAVWIGTDRNDPIRTADGEPIAGKDLPGRMWSEFMGAALDDRPVEPFPAYRPLGERPSDDPPGATPEPVPPPAPGPVAPPVPAPVAPGGPVPLVPVAPPGAPGDLVDGGISGGGLDGGRIDGGGIDGGGIDGGGIDGAGGLDGAAGGGGTDDLLFGTDPDCSATPCG